jgi:hypothetical protein
MSKQLILITAPFNCGYCKTAEKELPSLCESKGWDLIKMEDDPKDSVGANTYPTIMFRVNNKMVDTLNGYQKNEIEKNLKKY